ncbi:MAG: hypothetical protein GY730_11630 [bacterium]|nr:hypothetical protein [bacterium]
MKNKLKLYIKGFRIKVKRFLKTNSDTFWHCVKIPVFIMLAGVFICNQVFARVYVIPEELVQETREKRRLYKENPESNERRFDLAMCYAYTGRILKGLEILKKIPESYSSAVIGKYLPLVQKEPEEWKPRFKLAFGYYFENKKDKSIEEFKKILQQYPEHIWAMGYIALIEGEKNNLDECIKWCKKAIKIEPDAAAIHFLLEEGYRRKGNYFAAFAEACIVGRLLSEESLVRPDDKD